jgi:TolA-binding protein
MKTVQDQCPQEGALYSTPLDALSAAQEAHLATCPHCAKVWAQVVEQARLGASIPVEPMTQDREGALREALLARAAEGPQRPARPRWLMPLLAAAALALLCFVPLWMAQVGDVEDKVRAPAVVYRGQVHPQRGAQYVRVGAQPDEVIRLYEGSILVEVEGLKPGERFRVITMDAEVEVRGTAFEVRASEDLLSSVRVLHGRVAVRGEPVGEPIELGADERWTRPAAPEPAIKPAPPVEPPPLVIVAPEPTPQHVARHQTTRRHVEALHEVAVERAPEPAVVKSPSVAELRYQEGWGAMRAGDFNRASVAFEAVLGEPAGALAEDASYWRAVSLARAGRDVEAIGALREFLTRHPGAERAADVQAMLGWLLVSAGDEVGARAAFEQALRSEVPRVRESAQRGLSALDARAPEENIPP